MNGIKEFTLNSGIREALKENFLQNADEKTLRYWEKEKVDEVETWRRLAAYLHLNVEQSYLLFHIDLSIEEIEKNLKVIRAGKEI